MNLQLNLLLFNKNGKIILLTIIINQKIYVFVCLLKLREQMLTKSFSDSFKRGIFPISETSSNILRLTFFSSDFLQSHDK